MRMVVVGIFLAMCGGMRAQVAAGGLEAQLRGIAAEHHGGVALFAENLRTGETVGLDADRVVQTASVIKLGILYEALEQLRAGTLRWDDKVEMRAADRVPGSGVLHLLDAPLELTFKDVLTLMIVMSDNAATNLAIDHVGLANVDRRMASLGLKNTYLYKKIFTPVAPGVVLPADFKQFGLGKTTAREMVGLMGMIVECRLGAPVQAGDKALCGTAVEMLETQFYRGSIPRYLGRMPGAVDGSIANKTGALDAVRNDVGAVSTKAGMVVMGVFTYGNVDRTWGVDVEGELTIAKLARAVVERWSPGGLAAWPVGEVVAGSGSGLTK